VIAPCNWLQHFENVVDPYHVRSCTAASAARSSSSRWRCSQVTFRVRQTGREGDLDPAWSRRQALPARDRGGRADPARGGQSAGRAIRHGRIDRLTLPIDDTHYRIYVAGRVKEKASSPSFKSRYNGKTWASSRGGAPEVSGDTEAQVGQGPITFHSEEHLMSSDQGVGKKNACASSCRSRRHRGRRGDPIGVAFTEADAYVKLDAGQYLDGLALGEGQFRSQGDKSAAKVRRIQASTRGRDAWLRIAAGEQAVATKTTKSAA